MDANNKLPTGQQPEPDISDPKLVRRLLQAFCLGIVTGNKELRTEIEGSDFSTYEYERAFNSLKEGHADYLFLGKLLEEEFGLLWEKKDGLPTDAAFRRLKIDTKKNRLMRDLLEAIHTNDGMYSDFLTQKFIDDVKEAVRRLE